MDKIIEKLSSYHLLNYCIPGAVFWMVMEEVVNIKVGELNVGESIVIYYICGLIFSRIGSVIIEPLYIKLNIVKYAKTADYIDAEKEETKMSTLLEMNNMFRTFVPMCIAVLILEVAKLIPILAQIPQEVKVIFLSILLLILFSLSYRKQTLAIKKRVDCYISKKNNNLNR
ncbi:MAG: hypothetical protein K6G88_10435 [Lachnospiraceae bacterium]|nr:hypothetical protein [Lachnospiraceae bacterium]